MILIFDSYKVAKMLKPPLPLPTIILQMRKAKLKGKKNERRKEGREEEKVGERK